MNKEELRMSFLAGLITEGEYKQKLQEDGREAFLKLAQGSTSFNEFMNKATSHLQNISTSTLKPSGKVSPSLRKSLRLIWDDYQKGYLDLDEKQYLNENVVGIGAINSPFPTREKSDYELAFEHFTKGEVNEEMEGEKLRFTLQTTTIDGKDFYEILDTKRNRVEHRYPMEKEKEAQAKLNYLNGLFKDDEGYKEDIYNTYAIPRPTKKPTNSLDIDEEMDGDVDTGSKYEGTTMHDNIKFYGFVNIGNFKNGKTYTITANTPKALIQMLNRSYRELIQRDAKDYYSVTELLEDLVAYPLNPVNDDYAYVTTSKEKFNELLPKFPQAISSERYGTDISSPFDGIGMATDI